MTFVTIKGEWNLLTIFTGFSAAPTELFRTVISLSTLLHPRWKKKGTARKRVWSKAQFSWRHRWPGMRKQISVFFHLPRKHVWRCSFFLRFFCFFFFASFLHRENYIAKRHATLSRRYDIACCEFRVRLFARATTIADIYPSTPTC